MSFADFNQPAGVQIELENIWVKSSKYTMVRHSDKICHAVPERDRHAGKAAADCSRFADNSQYVDRELVDPIKENPY